MPAQVPRAGRPAASFSAIGAAQFVCVEHQRDRGRLATGDDQRVDVDHVVGRAHFVRDHTEHIEHAGVACEGTL